MKQNNNILPQYLLDSPFWEEIEKLNWPCDYESVANSLSNKEIKKIREFSEEVYCILNAFIIGRFGYTKLGVSDDGLFDLIAHIIGLGKESVLSHLHDPNLILKRAKNKDFKENFFYCFLKE